MLSWPLLRYTVREARAEACGKRMPVLWARARKLSGYVSIEL